MALPTTTLRFPPWKPCCLVLPPVNESLDTSASYSFLTHVTLPLAEGGYYVFPVAVVEETFRENGLTNPEEIHSLGLDKLYEVFGADSVMYITIKLRTGESGFELITVETRDEYAYGTTACLKGTAGCGSSQSGRLLALPVPYSGAGQNAVGHVGGKQASAGQSGDLCRR